MGNASTIHIVINFVTKRKFDDVLSGSMKENKQIFMYQIICKIPDNSFTLEFISLRKFTKEEFERIVKRALIRSARALLKRPSAPVNAQNLLNKAVDFLNRKIKLKRITPLCTYKIEVMYPFIDFDINGWRNYLPMKLIKKIKRLNTKFYNNHSFNLNKLCIFS